jgi:peptidyl-tRNA hydrolase
MVGRGRDNMKKSKCVISRDNSPHKLYILMRNDIPSMNPGKAMAQAAHAANHFMHFINYWGDESAKKYWMNIVKENWMSKDYPFGTTIVLSVNYPTLKETLDKAMRMYEIYSYITDPTYPFITNKEIATLISKDKQSQEAIYKDDGRVIMFREEITCGYIFLSDEDPHKQELVGDLPLHP